MMNKILKLGIQEEYPQYLKNKLRVSNVIFLIISIISVGYGAMVGIRMPEMQFVPIISLLGILAALGANLLGFHAVYRFLLCSLPIVVVFSYHIGVVPEGKAALPSSVAMTLAYTVLPFVIFDVRERLALSLSVLFSFITLLSFRWANSWIETSIDDELLRTGFSQEVALAVSFVILNTSVFFLNYFMYRTELKRVKLIEEAEQKNLELQQKGLELEEQMQKLERSKQEEQQRTWAAQGFTKFGIILRKHDDLQQLYDELISNLVKYINANQGALYVVEEKENKEVELELKACYAYNRKKFRENTIAPGQGLVGQCYLERDIVYLTEVPKGYTHITSGLGEATPSCILIVPLIANEKVEGVVEFAAFQPLPEHVLNFVKKLGEEIAATLSVGRINALTRQLLIQAQEQAEEMRAQEEEMRQNMEELSATQEEMQRKEKEYLRRIEELETGQEIA